MKRLLLVAAALAATVSAVVAWPVAADVPVDTTNGTVVGDLEDSVYDVANDVLSVVPMPEGWQRRHVCLIVDYVDRSWCVYFPFPL